MKKPILLVMLIAGAAAVIRKRGSSKADAELWREATTPRP